MKIKEDIIKNYAIDIKSEIKELNQYKESLMSDKFEDMEEEDKYHLYYIMGELKFLNDLFNVLTNAKVYKVLEEEKEAKGGNKKKVQH